MTGSSLRPWDGVRLHHFAVGAICIAGYVLGWRWPVWAALALSVGAIASFRLAVVAQLWRLIRRGSVGSPTTWFHHGVHRFEETARVVLLGAGLAFLESHHETVGWLLVLAASAIAILAGTTGFSFTTIAYAALRATLGSPRKRKDEDLPQGNARCAICRSLGAAPYPRCIWCNLQSVRSCCSLQTSFLLVLLLVIAFLLMATLAPVVTKILVVLSIVGVVALALATTRQTDELVGSLDSLAQAHRRAEERCEFLQALASCHSAEDAADLTAGFLESTLGTRRVSVMLADDENLLRIAASRGIPNEIAERVAVPVGSRLCGQVFATGQPVFLHDIQAQRPQDALGLVGAGEVICCPLVTAQMSATGRTIGVINVTNAPGGEFSKGDMTELKSVAKAAAIGLAGQLDHRDLEQSHYGSIVSLAVAMEAKDPYTIGHSSRVHHWATAVGRAMRLDVRALQILDYAGRLHDIGKLAIPDAILNAERKLTEQEWAAICQHPQRGVEMIKHLRFLKDAQPAIRHHHEHLDGSGYPDGLSGDEIPLEARIIAVVDAYDAMTSARAYRPAMPHKAAVEELRMYAGKQFDPQVVETFLHLLGAEVTCAVGEETRAYDE